MAPELQGVWQQNEQSVVVNYVSSREDAEKVVTEIVTAGGKSIAIQGDVSDTADIDRIIHQTLFAFGGAFS